MTASLTVTVQRLHGHLKYAKGDGATITLRTEFGKRVGADSTEFTAHLANDLELNHSTSFEITTETSAGVEEVANSRAVVQFFEVSKGDKKKKGDTVTALGWAEIDLLPLVEACTEFSTTCIVNLATPDETVPNPKLAVKVTISRPLLSQQQLETGNLLTISVPGVFSLPDSWNIGPPGAPTHTYSLSLPVPSSLDSDRVVQLTGGVVCAPRPDAVRMAEPDDGDLEGDFRSPDDVAFARDAQARRNAVRFPTSVLRVYLAPDALQRMLNRLPVTRVIPVEVRRFAIAAAGVKTKAKKGDEDESVFHGVCFAPGTPMLYPGATRIHGMYLMRPYIESDFVERMHLASAGEDPGKIAAVRRSRVPDSGLSKSVPADVEEIGLDSRMFAVLSLSLSRPLVARRPAAALIAQLSELIPPRPPLPRVVSSEAKVVGEYEAQIASVANMLLDEYRRAAVDEDPQNGEQIRQKLVYELNVSGKYHSVKEQLKHSIIKVVREKFLHTNSISDPAERHAFLSQLYVFLSEHMHKSSFSFAQTEHAAPPTLTVERIRQAAHEAEVLDDTAHASKLYQDLVARYRNDISSWYEYGCFASRAGDYARAEQCFREVLALQQTHEQALLAAAALALVCRRIEDVREMWVLGLMAQAAVLYEAATAVYPKSVLAWTVRALYYDAVDNDISKSMSLLQARKAAENGAAVAVRVCRALIPAGHPHPSMYLQAADHFTALGLVDLTQRALAQESATATSAFHVAAARMLLADRPLDVSKVEKAIDSALQQDYHNPDCWALLGRAQRHANPDRAREALLHCLDLPVPGTPSQDVVLLLASLYLKQHNYAAAKDMFVRYCRSTPSAIGWEGVGVSCLRLGQLEDAREALAESNSYDNTNAKVWGYLAIVCVRLKQKVEAEQSFKFAMTLGLHDAALLQEIRAAQEQAGFGNPFEAPLSAL